ncbi:30S ribosomal protein S17 [Halobacteriales archaeon QS_3_64_16]|nr:MAG: 30S ribosomal protein S17 [Halobacteriales archaeon QS_3_64_16]
MALGLGIDPPEATCDDENCPFHGTLSVRGATVDGVVASTNMHRSAIVEREYDVAVPKYDRHMKRRSRVPAHAPECLDIEEGRTVRIAETRPLSKTKSHVVVTTLETTRQLASDQVTEPATDASEAATGDVSENAATERGPGESGPETAGENA